MLNEQEVELAEKLHDFFVRNLDATETPEQKESYLLVSMLLGGMYDSAVAPMHRYESVEHVNENEDKESEDELDRLCLFSETG